MFRSGHEVSLGRVDRQENVAEIIFLVNEFNPLLCYNSCTMSQVAIIQGDHRRQNIKDAFTLLSSEDVAILDQAKKILIKPNLVHHYFQLASTHVDAVRGVIDVIREKTDAPVVVGDASYHGTKAAFRNFGYENLITEYENVSLCDLNDDETVEGYYLKQDGSKGKMQIAKTVVEADVRINLACMKTHRTTGVTLSLKNWAAGIWVVEPTQSLEGPHFARQPFFHQEGRRAQEETIVAIHQQCAPTFSVIDGFLAMEGNGPTNGEAVPMHLALASTDPVALDVTACQLMHVNPQDIGCLVIAGKQGYGESDPERISLLGQKKILELRNTFSLPETWKEKVLAWKSSIL